MSKLIGSEEEQRRERITFSIEQKVQQLCPNSKETLDKHLYIFFSVKSHSLEPKWLPITAFEML